MYAFLYQIITRFAPFFLRVIGEFIPRIDRFNARRKNGHIPAPGPKKFWIHCSSFGEYEMARPLIDMLLKEHNLQDLLITTFSPSGYRQASQGPFQDVVMYLPLDTLPAVKKFYDDYQPENALFIRYDFWFNFINEGLKRKVKFFLVNGRFSQQHFVFKWYGRPYAELISKFEHLFISDQLSADRLKTRECQNCSITGDTRYDRVMQTLTEDRQFPDIEKFKGNRSLLIAGSSWKPEEDLILELLQCDIPDLAIIIAPHDIIRSEQIFDRFAGFEPKLYSSGNISNNDKLVILDTMGMLSALYKYADLALIGGGFSGKLHNILEPAVWGCHISFGPNTEKFPEAQDFIDGGFATPIDDDHEWTKIIRQLAGDPKLRNEIRDRATSFTNSHLGASQLVINRVLEQ